jgi:hypothetical protein
MLKSALLSAAALLLAVPSTDGLMFHSLAVKTQWDTWVFVENRTFCTFNLIKSWKIGNKQANELPFHQLLHACARMSRLDPFSNTSGGDVAT